MSMKNSKVYCLISVRSCFEIIFKFNVFLPPLLIEVGGLIWLLYSGRLLYRSPYNSSKNYHQEHATDPYRLPKNVAAAWGATILRFHGISNRYK